ncbi:MAG: cobalamin-dependent protein [Anaerolineales bacterium]|nr:cobalamin-dependent protein [Anaerolineales bacterium]
MTVDEQDANTLRASLVTSVADLDEDAALALVTAMLQRGDNPLGIIEISQEGLRQVGERYERQEYFLSGLIMAGEIFRGVMALVRPTLELQHSGNESGAILLGTVQGDIHDIGKNNLSMLLSCYGFSVHDLGVDVPPAEFLAQARQIRPDLIGLSGLLTSSYDAMRDTVRLLRASGDAGVAATPIVIGGNQLNEQVCQYVGADFWVTDAMTGVRLCQQLLTSKSP